MTDDGPRGLRALQLDVAVGGGLLLATGLRVGLAANREVWLDESHSALLARMPMADLFESVRGDVHPPGYFLALNLWARLFGDSELALRSLSIVAVAVATLGVFVLARRAFGRKLGVLASVLFGLSPVLVFYGTEVRMYGLAVLWAVATLLTYQRLFEPRESARVYGVITGVLGALIFLTHYIGLFFLVALYLHWAYQVLRRRLEIRHLLVAGVVTAALTAPWAPVLLEQRARKENLRLAQQSALVDSTTLNYKADAVFSRPMGANLRVLAENGASILGVYPAERPFVMAILAVPVVVAVGSLVAAAVGGGVWSGLALIGVVTTAAAGLSLGFTARRFLLLALPLLILGAIEGLIWLRDRGWPRVAAAVAAGLLIVTAAGAVRTAVASQGRPLGALIHHLESRYRPQDLVVFDAMYAAVPFDYHARQSSFRYQGRGFPTDIEDWWRAQPFKGWGGPVVRRPELARFIAELSSVAGRQVWLVLFETGYYDPNDELLAGLRRSARTAEPVVIPETAAAGYRLFRFEF